MWYHLALNKKVFLCIVCISVLTYPDIRLIYGQEKFLLTEAEMPGFELRRQSNRSWEIGEGLRNDRAIEQWWQASGTNSNYGIQYCEFDSAPEALSGTAYKAQSYSIPSIWGSLNGIIPGDAAWVSTLDGGMFFVRGNVGIKIGVIPFTEVDRQVLIQIANKVLEKIESNLSQDILDTETAARQKQIPEADYLSVTNQVIIFTGFSHHSTWDSKWLPDANNLAMGIRQEWKSPSGIVVGIDISAFDSPELAKSAVERKTQNGLCPAFVQAEHGYCPVFELDELDSLRVILEEWQNTRKNFFTEYNFSVVGYKDNLAIHYYQFDTTRVKTDFVYSLLEKLSEDMVNF